VLETAGRQIRPASRRCRHRPLRQRRPWRGSGSPGPSGAARIGVDEVHPRGRALRTAASGLGTAGDHGAQPSRAKIRMTGGLAAKVPHPPCQQPQPFGFCLSSLPFKQTVAGPGRFQAGGGPLRLQRWDWSTRPDSLRQSMAGSKSSTQAGSRAIAALAAAPDTTGSSSTPSPLDSPAATGVQQFPSRSPIQSDSERPARQHVKDANRAWAEGRLFRGAQHPPE